MLSSTINGTDFGAQEWRYSLLLRYGIDPCDLSEHYYGCGAAFLILHALDCKKGGLLPVRHNELCDGVADLDGKDFTPHMYVTTPKFSQVAPCVGEGQSQRQGGTTTGRGGAEGGYPNPRPLDAGYRHYSQHACREH